MDALPNKPYDADERMMCKPLLELIHGVAGSGKTTLVALMVHDLQVRGYKVFMTAPTHKAAQQLKKAFDTKSTDHYDGEPPTLAKVLSSPIIQRRPAFIGTIHSALGLKITYEEDQQVLSATGYPKTSSKNKWSRRMDYHCDILFCDEGSMVSTFLDSNIKTRQKEEKFHLVYIGDKYQLEPPDGDGEPSPVFDIPTPTIIDEVTRQAADSPIIKFSISCREKIDYYEGRRPDNPPFSFGDWMDGETMCMLKMDKVVSKYLEMIDNCAVNSQNYRILSFTNDRVDSFNRIIRKQLFGSDAAPYEVGEIVVMQDSSPNQVFSNNEDVRIIAVEKVEEIIMAPKEFGELGEVIRSIDGIFNGYKVTLQSLEDDDITESVVMFDVHERAEYDEWIGKLSRFYATLKTRVSPKASKVGWAAFWDIKSKYPTVKPCFASTVHKAQGSTLKEVIFDLETTKPFLRTRPKTAWRLIYVAATRPELTVHFAIS
jgi:GTPase SAR1 family protein